jgi:glycosyltransferase involved in cell wall biosynthesis
MKLVVAGASTAEVCGVRDCADVLTPALEAAGASVEVVWWRRAPGDGFAATARAARKHAAEIRAHDADAVLWHYSVFSYGPRGLPVGTPAVARALRGGAPVVGFLHELAFPWGVRGVRGATQAVAQRAVLRPLLRTLAGAVVTTESRLAWLRGHPLLPRLPLTFLPVPSNLAVVPQADAERNGSLRVGVFGYGTDGNDVDTAVDAIAALRRRGVDARLELVGAPGPGSAQAGRWLRAAGRAGVGDLVTLTGVQPAHVLSGTLQKLDAVLLPDRSGPSARRGSLAAALAHGRAVVAFDGRARWEQPVRERALVVAPPAADAVADALERLARDDDERRAQGERARVFYARTMSADVVAQGLLSFVREVAQ